MNIRAGPAVVLGTADENKGGKTASARGIAPGGDGTCGGEFGGDGGGDDVGGTREMSLAGPERTVPSPVELRASARLRAAADLDEAAAPPG